jgi:uncharacterized protein
VKTTANKDSYVVSHGGREISVLNPKPEDIVLSDIALGLGAINRFLGKTRLPYNVAQHSCTVSAYVEQAFEKGVDRDATIKAALLHDAAEAYLGDIINPVKVHLPIFDEIEYKWQQAIADRFGFGVTFFGHALVKEADRAAYAVEVSALIENPKGYYSNRKDLARAVADATLKAPTAFLSVPKAWSQSTAVSKFLTVAKGLGLS